MADVITQTNVSLEPPKFKEQYDNFIGGKYTFERLVEILTKPQPKQSVHIA